MLIMGQIILKFLLKIWEQGGGENLKPELYKSVQKECVKCKAQIENGKNRND